MDPARNPAPDTRRLMRVPTTAMVLAAGLGTRMHPVTLDRPKALVRVGDRALIDHMLDRLAASGVERAVVNVHAFADLLLDHLALRTGGPEIVISDERNHPAPLETGGGIKAARRQLGDAPILVANIDSVWVEDHEPPGEAIERLCQAFDPERETARLLLARMERTSGFDGPGDFFIAAQDRLAARRVTGAASAPLNYMGVHVVDPAAIYDHSGEAFGLFPLWVDWAANGRLAGTLMEGDWMHVGDPTALDVAQARLAR